MMENSRSASQTLIRSGSAGSCRLAPDQLAHEQIEDLAFSDLEGDVIDRDEVAVTLAQTAGPDRNAHRRHLPQDPT
jgi:hypothetical protein